MFKIIKILFLLLLIFQVGCNVEAEVGYSLPGNIIRVSINSVGKIILSSSLPIRTPIGLFDLTVGMTIFDLQSQFNKRILMIIVDDSVTIYEIDEGKKFG